MTSARSNVFPLEPTWRPLLKDLGVSPRTVLRRAELPADLLSRDSATLSTVEYFRLWKALEQEVADPMFPIRVSEVLKAEAFHPLVFASLCSTNLSVAVQRIAHYKRLVAPMELHVAQTDETLQLELVWLDRTVEPPASLAAFELVFFLQLARVATREHIRAVRIESLVPLRPAKEYTSFFGVRARRADRHAITFSAADAQRPFLTANEGMWRVFEPALRRRLSDLEASAAMRERVRAALLEALPAGEASMEHVARKLALSKRTLQRRLREENTTFQAVLNATREDLARHYLARTKLSGAEIAYLLGFEDPNSFFRAFHTWTGQTTEQARLTSAR